MSKSIYLLGYGVGKKTAESCSNSIRESKFKHELATLAGRKLTAIRKNPRKEDVFVNTESWALGFWEGFMDRADDMK